MPTIFLSHAAADAEIATDFKLTTEQSFLGLCNIFVSSNLDSINAGAEWHGVIKQNLTDSVFVVGLLSPTALQRGWVYCEFGAGWIRNIPVIPLCHSGLDRGQLPAPLSSFQALNLNTAAHLSHLYGQIAAVLNCNKPEVNFENLVSRYLQITDVKRIESLIKNWLQSLFQWNSDFKSYIERDIQDELIQIMIPAQVDMPFQEFMDVMRQREILLIERAGFAMGTRVGPQATVLAVSKGKNIDDLRRLFMPAPV